MLDELRKACAATEDSEARTLADGPLVSHLGYPAPAPSGAIALKLADVVTVIREADVLRVERKDGLYCVWTRSDANIILRLEKVAKAGGDVVPCGCGDKPDGDSLAREIDIDIGPVVVTPLYCQTRRICTTVFGRPFCYNIVVCRPADGGPPVSWPE